MQNLNTRPSNNRCMICYYGHSCEMNTLQIYANPVNFVSYLNPTIKTMFECECLVSRA